MVEKLTKKEQEILQFLVKGNLNKEIGNELDIALDTVKKRMEEIVGQRNPGDPYAETPHVRERLQEKLKS